MKEKIENSGEIVLHFDVPDHSIPLDQFFKNAYGSKKIIQDFNRVLFNDEPDLEFLILPPEEGSWRGKIRIVVKIGSYGLGVILAFLTSEPGQVIVEHYSGNEPKYYYKLVLDYISGKDDKARDANKEYYSEQRIADQKTNLIIEEILKDCTVAFLSASNRELEVKDFSTDKFRNAYIGRNEFYLACIANTKIKAIGFDSSQKFSIKQKEFSDHIVEIVEDKSAEEEKLFYDIFDLEIYSPTWDTKSKLKWGAIISDTQENIIFDIKDAKFKTTYQKDSLDLPSTTKHRAKMQCTYQVKDQKKINVTAVSVLSYNGKKISRKYTFEEMERLYDISLKKEKIEQTEQLDLFGEKTN